MKKRFLDIDIWDDDWFIEASNETKLVWIYLFSRCNHAGIWEYKKNITALNLGTGIDIIEQINLLNKDKFRIAKIGKNKYFIVDFPKFQQNGNLSNSSNVHKSIIKNLLENGIPLSEKIENKRSTFSVNTKLLKELNDRHIETNLTLGQELGNSSATLEQPLSNSCPIVEQELGNSYSNSNSNIDYHKQINNNTNMIVQKLKNFKFKTKTSNGKPDKDFELDLELFQEIKNTISVENEFIFTELLKLKTWVDKQPINKRKTFKGMPSFLVSNISREARNIKDQKQTGKHYANNTANHEKYRDNRAKFKQELGISTD